MAREREVEKLERIIAGDGFWSIAVYGRRRVGKSELIRHVVADKDHLYFQATSDREFNSIPAEDGCAGTILDIHVSSEGIILHKLL